MRKILASFLMLVMFTSAIMCSCNHEARAESSATHHSHHDDGDHHHDKGGTLSQDCQKTDMQLPAHTDIGKPDLKNYVHLDFTLANEMPVWSIASANDGSIRGPPLWDRPFYSKPSIILTTQRLRI